MARPQSIPPTVRCHRYPSGARASIRVWGSTLRWHLCTDITSAHAPDGRLRQALESGKK
jgi:hypothetical protein